MLYESYLEIHTLARGEHYRSDEPIVKSEDAAEIRNNFYILFRKRRISKHIVCTGSP
jgi:hypothetical protein